MGKKPAGTPKSDPSSGAPPQRDWIEVFITLARAVPSPLAGIVLVILYIIFRVGERFSEMGALVAMIVLAVVTVAYFYFYGEAFKREEQRRAEAEDASEAKSRRLEAVHSVSTPARQVWSRLEVKLDLPEEILLGFRKRLEDVQAVAFTWLSEKAPGVRRNAVRVNLMLPDNRRAHYGEVCHLFIPEWLHVNMDASPDREIRFALTQGLVGKVFSSSRAGGALLSNGTWTRVFFGEAEPKEPGKPDFELTEWQKKLLHPDLRWVLALPLIFKDADEQTRALGVLDIDGVGFDLDADGLRQLYFHIVEKVTVIAAELGSLPKQRLTIAVQEATA